MTRLFLSSAALLLFVAEVLAGPKVDVVVGPDTPSLELFAARELAGQFEQLFDAEVKVTETLPEKSPNLILLGSPATNPAVRTAVGERWPKLSEQGHWVRTLEREGRKVLVVGGGSPVATLWAVYELGHHFGIRYFLHTDVMPARKPEFQLDNLAITLEPTLRQRTWRTVSDFPIGFESWGLAEQKRTLRQLAKMKFNRVLLSLHPWQPFVHFEYRDVPKQTGVLWYGWRYPVDGDTGGRAAFRGIKEFTNPDFAGTASYEQRRKAGETLVTGIIDAAHELGMSAAISLFPLEFPREFEKVLPGATLRPLPEKLTLGPGTHAPDDVALRGLAAAHVRACLATYPKIDALYLSVAGPPAWEAHADSAWKDLDSRTGVGKTTTLAKLTPAEESRRRTLHANIAAVDFLHRLLDDRELLRRPGRIPLEVVAWGIDPALFPVLDQVLPAGVNTLHFIEPTARRVAAKRELLGAAPAGKRKSRLFLTLSEDNVGVLPQLATSDVHTLVTALRQHEWAGYSTRCWVAGDLNPSLHYLSRAGFDARLTPKIAYDDLFTTICGEGVIERLAQGLERIEEATALTDANDFGFSLPTPNVVMKHYTAEAPPEWWKTARTLYTGAMNEMYRAKQRSTGTHTDPLLLYHAKRCEFAIHYFSCVESVRLAGQAKAKGEREKQIEELEKATEAIYNALNALGEVARDNSDRGIIAALNEYGYRPLRNELAAADKAANQE